MIGMIYAIPTTPLHARLKLENRLDMADDPIYGTNVIPARLGREELRDGYLRMLTDLHEPTAFFDRLDSLYLDGPLAQDHGRTAQLKPMPWRRAAEQLKLTALAMVLLFRITLKVPDRSLKLFYLSRFMKVLFRRPLPAILFVYAMRSAMHYHGWKLARSMADPANRIVNSY
jgi:hypothetical protein